MGLFGTNIKKMKDNKDIADLIQLLKGRLDPNTQTGAIIALAYCGDQAIEPIFQAIRNIPQDKTLKDMFLQRNFEFNMTLALSFLGIMIGETAIECYFRTLQNKSEDGFVREAVAKALGYCAHESFIDPLIEILKDKEEKSSAVKRGVVKALKLMQDPTERVKTILATLKGHEYEGNELFEKAKRLPVRVNTERIVEALKQHE